MRTQLPATTSSDLVTTSAAQCNIGASGMSPLAKLSRWMRRAQAHMAGTRIPFFAWLADQLRFAGRLRRSYEKRRLARITTLLLLPFVPTLVQALPAGEQVVGGQATIARPTTQSLIVNQSTNKAAIDWRNFNIGRGESVVFNQPNAQSVTLNRVLSADPSQIFGSLRANGSVFLTNSAGVYFAPGASVNVGSFVGTTLSINNNDFMAGNYRFTNDGKAGAVINDGSITVQPGGHVGLYGPQVTNNGVINANDGSVNLAAGDRVTMTMGSGVVKVNVDAAALKAKIENKGQIIADGGQVMLSARASDALLDTVINTSGTIRANSLQQKNGKIVLDGGSRGVVEVAGTLSATSDKVGGSVQVLGDKVGLVGNASVDVSGKNGGGEVLVGGNFQGKGPEQNANTAFVGKDVSIKADATSQGDGGKVVVWADDTTRFGGSISAKGGALGGNGGQVETSGKQVLLATGSVNASAAKGKAGEWLLDPLSLSIETTANDGIDSSNAPIYVNTKDNAVLQNTVLNAALTGGTTVTIKTDGSTANAGNITINAPITAAGDATLKLQAHNAISMTATGSIDGNGNTLNVNLVAGFDQVSGTIAMNSASSIVTKGTVAMSSVGAVTVSNIDTSSGVSGSSVSITNAGSGTVSQNGAIKTGSLSISNPSGNITLTHADNEIASLGVINAGTTNTFSLTNKVDMGQTGALTANKLVLTNTTGDTTLTNTSNAINHLGAIDATGRVFTLTNNATIDQSAASPMKAGVLVMTNTVGDIKLEDSGNQISSLGPIKVNASGKTFSLTNTVDLTQNDLTVGGELQVDTLKLSSSGHDVTLNNTNNTVSHLGNINVTGKTLTLNNKHSLDQTSGTITASTLVLNNTVGNADLGSASNSVTTLGAITNTGGDFSFKNGADLTASGAINVGSTHDASFNVGSNKFSASGTVTANNLKITADTINLTGMTATAVTTATVVPSTSNRDVSLGTTTGGDLSFLAADITALSGAANVVIGNSSTDEIDLNAATNFGSTVLTLKGSSVTNGNNSGRGITAGTVNFATSGAVGSSRTIDVTANNVSVNTTNSNAKITASGAVVVGASDIGTGDLTLAAGGAITQSGAVKANILNVSTTSNANANFAANGITNTIARLDYVDVGTGTFSLTNGGALTQTNNATGVTAGIFNLTNTAADANLYGAYNHIASLGDVDVTGHKFTMYNVGNVTQSGNGGLKASSILLYGTGSYTLTSSGNNVSNIELVSVDGNFTFSNGGHNLGTTGSITVDTANNKNVSIDVGTGTFTPGSSAISAKNLTITGDGVNLDALNAGSVSTSILVQPSTLSTAIGLGTANSGSGFNLSSTALGKVVAIGGTTIGIGAAGGTGNINLAGAVNYAGNNLTLEGGAITGSGLISADSVTLRNNGGDIGSSSNAVNLNTAALSVNSTGNGSAYVADSRGFALGASNVGTGTLSISAGNANTGITQSGALTAGHLAVNNIYGTTVLNNANNAIADLGTFNATGRAVTIVNKSALTQSGALSATSLTYSNTTSNAGDTTLTYSGNNVSNSVGTLAAVNTSAAGNFSFANGNNALTTTGTINAGVHDVTLSSGTAALTPGAFAITANNLTLTSDSPNFANLTGPVAGTLTYQQATAAKKINFNASGTNNSTDLYLSSTAITQLKNTGAANYVIGSDSASAGALTIGASSDFSNKSLTLRGGSISDSGTKTLTATTVNLQANGGNIGSSSDSIDIAANNFSATTTGTGSAYVKAASGAVVVKASDVKGTFGITAAGALSQGGIISADTLAVTDTATADVNFNTFANTINKIGAVSVDSTKTFNLKVDSTSLTQASGTGISTGTLKFENANANGATDLSSSTNAITNLGAVTNTGGNFTLKNGANKSLTLTGAVNVAGHDVTLETSGTGTLATGSSLITANNLTLSADKFSMGGLNVAVSGDVTVQPISAGTDIYVGGPSVANAFSLTTELGTLNSSSATKVVIGRSDGTGRVIIHGEVDLSNKPLTLRGGSIEDDSHGTANVVKATTLTFNANSANGAIGGAGNDAIDIAVTNVSPNTNGGSVYLASTTGYNIGTTDTNGGTISLTAGGAIGQSGVLKAGTLNVTNTAGATDLSGQTNLIDTLGTINAAGQTFSLTNGKALTQSGILTATTLNLTNSVGNTTLNTQNNAVANLGTITTGGDFLFSNGNTSLTTNGAIDATGHSVAISAGSGTLTTNNQDITAQDLTLTADNMALSTLKATVANTLTVQPGTASTAITLGDTPGGTLGIDATAITKLKTSGATSYFFGASAGSGAVTLAAPLDFSGKTVTLRGGSFSDGNTTANVLTASTANFIIGSGNGAVGGSGNNAIDLAVTNASVTTNGGSAYLTSTGGYTLATSNVGSGMLTLGAAGALDQSGILTADTLSVTNTTGDTTLNSANSVSNLGAFSAGTRTVSITNAKALNQSGVMTAGVLNLTNTAGDTTLSSANQIAKLGTVDVSGKALSLTNTVATTQTGIIKAGTLAISNTAADVDFSSQSNQISQLGVVDTGTHNFALQNTVAMTQTGAMKTAKLDLTNTNFDTSLSNANNQIADLGTINASGKSFSLTNTVATTQSGTITANTLALTNTTAATTLNNANAIANLGAVDATGQVLTLNNTIAMSQTGVLKAGTLNLSNASANTDLSGFDNQIATLGTINVGANDFALKDVSALTQTGVLTANKLTLNSTGGATNLSQANKINVLGDVTSTAGDFSLTNDAALTVNGTITATNKNVSINNGNNNITIATTSVAASSLTVTTGAAMTQSGALSNTGSSSFTSVGDMTLDSATNNLVGAVSVNNAGSGNISLKNNRELTLGTSTVGTGTLTVAMGATGGDIKQQGAITQTGTAAVSFSAGTHAIKLDAANVLKGEVALANSGGNAVEIKNAGALNLGTVTVGTDTLKITSSGDLTQTGIISQSGSGAVTIAAGAGDITLTQNNVFAGAVAMSNSAGKNAVLNNSGNLQLGTTTIGNNLTVTSTGNITSGSLTAGNDINLTAATNVGAATNSKNVDVINAGHDLNITSGTAMETGKSIAGHNMTLVSGAALTVGKSTVGNNLSLKAHGDITQDTGSNALSVTGTTTAIIKDGTAGVQLVNDQNNFTGALTIQSEGTGVVQDVGIGSANLPLNSITFPQTTLRNLTLNFSQAGIDLGALTLINGGNLSVTTNGQITQSGALVVPGTANFNSHAFPITLDKANSFSNSVSINNSGSNAITLKNTGDLILGASNVGKGNIAITSSNGNITQSGAMVHEDLGGTTSFNTATGMTLDAANKFKGGVTFAAPLGDVTINALNDLNLGTSTLGAGKLTVTAGGIVTQSGAITQSGSAAVNFNAAQLNLNAANDFVGALKANNSGTSAMTITDVNALNLGEITSTSGAVTINTGGALTQSNIITQTGAGAVTLNVGTGAVTLEGANAIQGALSINSNTASTADVSINNSGSLLLDTSTLGSGGFKVAATGISQNGAIKQNGAGAVNLNAGTGALDLHNVANEFLGGIKLANSGSQAITFVNNKATSITSVDTGTGALSITSIGGSLTQTGAIKQNSASTATATFDAKGNTLNLANANNELFGKVSLNNTGSGIVTFNDSKALTLAASTVGSGQLTVSSDVSIAQSGALVQDSAATGATFTAVAGSIDLASQNNSLTTTGPVKLSTPNGSNASVKSSSSLVLGTGSIGNNLVVTSGGNITQNGTLTVNGTSTFNTTGVNANVLLSDHNNVFLQDVTITPLSGNVLDVTVSNSAAPAANPHLPSNLHSLTLEFGSAGLTLPELDLSGNLVAISGGDIAQSANTKLKVEGTSSFTTGAHKITLDSTSNQFKGAVDLHNSGDFDVLLKNNRNLTLGASTVGVGKLEVSANGSIAQIAATGIVQGTTTKTTSFKATAGGITLDQANSLTAPIDLTSASSFDISIANNGPVQLGTLSLGNNLTVAAGGTISQNNPLQTGGSVTLKITNNTGDVTLNNTDNDFTGALSVLQVAPGTVNNISVFNRNGTANTPTMPSTGVNNLTLNFPFAQLALPAVKINGNLSVTTGGQISQQSGTSLDIGGLSSFTAGSNPILLDGTANKFVNAITLSNSGSNNIVLKAASPVILAASNIGSGTLDVTVSGSTGGISQTGALTQSGAGAVTMNAGANDLLLNSNNEFLGTVNLSNSGSHNISVVDTNGLALGTVNAGQGMTASVAAGNLTMGSATVGQNLSLTATTGNVTTTGNTTVTQNMTVNAGAEVSLGASTVGQALSVTAAGQISQTGILKVAQAANFNVTGLGATNDILLAGQANEFSGAVTFSGTLRDIALRNAVSGATLPSLSNNIRNLTLQFDQAGISLPAATLTGNLSVTAGGDIKQINSGANLSVDGTSTFTTTNHKIDISNAGNVLKGVVSLNNQGANSVALTNNYNLQLGASNVGSGTLTVSTTGTLSQGAGALVQEANALATSFTSGAGQTLTLDNVGNNLTGEIQLHNSGAANVVLNNNSSTKLGTSSLGTGTLTVTSAGAIGQGGAIVQAASAGLATFNAGANSIELNNVSNHFTGEVALSNSGSTSNTKIANAGALQLAASTVGGGTLDVIATGAISQSGALTQVGGTGAVTVDAGAASITLDKVGNDFLGAVSLKTTGSGDVTIKDANALTLGVSTVGTGALKVTAVGAINQGGSIKQLAGAGAATFDSGASITLDNIANDFTGAVVLKNTGNNDITLVDANALILGPSNIGQGKLNVTAGGALTQNGALVQAGAAGDTKIIAGSNAITLNNTGNKFTGTVSLSNSGTNNVVLTNSAALNLGEVKVGSGSLIIDAVGAISQTGVLTQSANAGAASISAGNNTITLTNTGNDFTGTLTLTNGGTNGIKIVDANDLIIGSSNIGSGGLSLTAAGSISQTGAITQAPGSSASAIKAGSGIRLNSNNSFTGAVGLTNTSGLVEIKNSGGLALAESQTGSGQVIVVAGGDITQTGAMVQSANAESVSFSAGNSAIEITNLGNQFTGAVSLSNSGSGVAAVTNSTALKLGASTVGKDLKVVAGGHITQSGVLTVPGDASFTMNTGLLQNVTLGEANDFAGTVSILNGSGTVADVTLHNVHPNSTGSGKLILPDHLRNLTLKYDNSALAMSGATLSGTLEITTGGAISQTGPLVVAGAATFNAGGNAITLDKDNDFGAALNLTNTGSNNVTVKDINALELGKVTVGSGTLTVNAGAIKQTNSITQEQNAGKASFSAGANSINLNNADNDFTGAVLLSNSGNNNVTLRDKNALILGESRIGSGNLVVVANGAISQSGAIIQAPAAGGASFNAGANSITLNDADNDFTGAVTLANSGANNVSLRDTNSLTVAASSVGSGSLSLTSNGALTQTGIVTQEALAGQVSLSAGAGVINFNNVGNNLTGTVALSNTGANAVTLTNAHAINLAASNVGSGQLTVTAQGAITQSGALKQAQGAVGASFNAGSSAINLNNSANDFTGGVSVNNSGANDVTIVDANALNLAASSVGNGNLNITAGGKIEQTGALTQATASGSTAQTTVSAGANTISLNATGNDFTLPISVNGGDTQVVDKNGLIMGKSTVAGSLSLNSTGGNISQVGAVTVKGTTTIEAGAGEVTLTNANNDFAAVSINAAKASVNDINDLSVSGNVTGNLNTTSKPLNFGNLVVGGNITANASGAITQTAGTAIESQGTTTLAAGTNAVTLTQANDFNGVVVTASSAQITDKSALTLTATTSGDVVANSAALTLGTSTIGGNLAVTASGAVGQSGAVVVNGKTNIAAGANSISLQEANDFKGAVSLSNTGAANEVKIKDSNAVLLDNVKTESNLTINAVGITQVDGSSVVAGGNASLNGGSGAITLESAKNDFAGNLSLNTSAGASVVDANGVQLGGSNVASLKVVASQGAITQAEVVTVSGATSLDAGGNAITLTKANDFGGKVTAKGGATQITSSKALDVNLNTTGATTLVAATDLAVAGNVAGGNLNITTAKGVINATTVEKDLILTSTGGVTQKGALKVGGATDIKSSGGSVDLTDAGNDFIGKVSIDGSANVVDANALNVTLSGKGDVSVAAGGALDISGTANNVTTSAVGKTNFGDLSVTQKLNIFSLGGELFVLDGKLLSANEIDFTMPKNVNLGSYANQFHIESAENILVLAGGNGYIQIPVTSKVKTSVKVALGVGCVTVNNGPCVNGSAVISGAISAVQSGALSGLTAKLQREDASTKKLTYGFAGDLQQVQSYPHEGGLEVRALPTCRTGSTIGQGTGNKGFAVQNGVDCGSASNGEVEEKISQGFVGDLQQARSLPHEGALEVKTLPTCSTADAAQAAAKGVSLDASKCQPAKAVESAPVKPIAENGAAKSEPVRANLAAK